MAFASSTVLAQDTPKKPSFAGFVSNGFWDNWEVSFGLGTGTAFSNGGNIGPHSERFGFEGNLSLTKWLPSGSRSPRPAAGWILQQLPPDA